jgi:hypothetical protein
MGRLEFDAPQCDRRGRISRAGPRAGMLWIAHMRNRAYGSGRALPPALLLASLLGCTSGTSGPSVTTGTTDALASQLATAFCTAQAACCGPTDGGAATGSCGGGTSGADGGPSTCLARATLSADQQLALVATAFSEGLLTIDPTTASTCVTAYQATSCTTLAGQTEPDIQAALDSPACVGLFTGYIPVGERCDMTAECTLHSYCQAQGTGQNVTSIDGSGTLGVCFPFQQAGDACNTSDDCDLTLACSPTTLVCR